MYIKSIYDYLKISNINIEYYETLPSTNSYLKERAKSEKEGLVVIANNQTSGRGRFDRKFYSPDNTGIYMSILLKPAFNNFDATLITTAAAVAVARATEKLSGKVTKIKWVNDVLINDKKICGILTEGSINPQNSNPDYVVLGIGVNAFAPENGFQNEIKSIAGYVFEEYNPDIKANFTAEIINQFFKYYQAMPNRFFLDEYRQRSAVIGKEITVIKSDAKIPATALSIDDRCRLEVKYTDGTYEFLSSGEISIKL
ncbi:MAG: biotin--[Clostridia bacterium]|nr:biotin--[acetyl-CoA-carboxylase] ligase [Clostridia bacterium]